MSFAAEPNVYHDSREGCPVSLISDMVAAIESSMEGTGGREPGDGRLPGRVLVCCLALAIPFTAAGKTVLVFGPHPDDEVLFAAGRIRSGVVGGDTVKVVLVTNGDAGGVEVGSTRQGESVAAAQLLGLTENDVIFLGYPDGSMTELHDAAPGQVIVSAAGQNATYGNRGLGGLDYHRYLYGVPGPYTRDTALEDFIAVMTHYPPDEVFTVGEIDSHPDHQATARFVADALTALSQPGQTLATALYQTLVWAPGVCEVPDCWPYVAGVTPAMSFQRPDAIDPVLWDQRRSFVVPLEMQSTDPAVNLKDLAIGQYVSQLTPENDTWFYSFARRDEFFWRTDFCAGTSCNLGLPNGALCTVGGQCVSTNCVDGVCCGTACSGQCQACNLVSSLGSCVTVTSGQPAGTRPACTGAGTSCGGTCDGTSATECHYPGITVSCRDASCSGGMATAAANCDGAGLCPAAAIVPCSPYLCGPTACRTSCGGDEDCIGADYCSVGICSPKLSTGAVCTAGNQCTSGHCTDGRCCDSSCGGQCQACDVAGHLGTCTTVAGGQPHGTRAACAGVGTVCGSTCDGTSATECHYPGITVSCRDASCSGGMATAAANCDGAGLCPAAAIVPCSPYLCGPTACRTSCGGDEDCIGADYCSVGICSPKLSTGAVCTAGNQCTSGHCTDGRCCDSNCGGQCQACDVAGHLGTCTTVAGGQPHGTRAACAGAGTVCGSTCDGTSATECHYPGAAVSCRDASCSGGTATAAANCDGAGLCPAAVVVPCSPYLCGPNSCRTGCIQDDDCSIGYHCGTGACLELRAQGDSCQTDGECASGHCTDGYCCDGTCDGQCQACDIAGHLGTCTAALGAPHGLRPTCSGTGTTCGGACDGSSVTNCRYPGAATLCRAAVCSAGTATLSAGCDGNGACPAASTIDCRPYVCGSTSCLDSCDGDTDCSSDHSCAAGRCQVIEAPGGSQSGSGGCSSGNATGIWMVVLLGCLARTRFWRAGFSGRTSRRFSPTPPAPG